MKLAFEVAIMVAAVVAVSYCFGRMVRIYETSKRISIFRQEKLTTR